SDLSRTDVAAGGPARIGGRDEPGMERWRARLQGRRVQLQLRYRSLRVHLRARELVQSRMRRRQLPRAMRAGVDVQSGVRRWQLPGAVRWGRDLQPDVRRWALSAIV